MKKSTIWLLSLMMAFTFIGLLYLQISYMNNIFTVRYQQFSESVKRSLYGVSLSLELDETKEYLLNDLEQELLSYNDQELLNIQEKSLKINQNKQESTINISSRINRKQPISPNSSLSTTPGKSSISNTYRNIQETLKGRMLYQKKLLDEVALSLLYTAGHRPIMERLEPRQVETYLRTELQNNGLNIPFQFAILNKRGEIEWHSSTWAPHNPSGLFTQTLFPNDDTDNRYNTLQVYFPTQQHYLFDSIRFMIPSFVFTFILLITFLFTIATAFRQKKLSEMKNDFINNMTHELKTPVSTISLAAQMLNDPAVAKSPTMFQHIAGVINDETTRLRFQIEKVLLMSMFDQQKTTLKLINIDANKAISKILSTFQLKVEKYGGTLRAELEPSDCNIWVDEMHFTNVIFNLLDNAVKYSYEGRPLELFVKTWIDGDKFNISIQDNGIGIKKEDIKKIFDRFYRVSTGNRHDVKGFGLGLAYVHKIIKDMNGVIRVESEYHIGTKFIITFPLTKNQ